MQRTKKGGGTDERQLYKKQEEYISAQLKSEDYQNASEVVRDALRLHEVYRHRVIEELRAEMPKGWEGPASPRKVPFAKFEAAKTVGHTRNRLG